MIRDNSHMRHTLPRIERKTADESIRTLPTPFPQIWLWVRIVEREIILPCTLWLINVVTVSTWTILIVCWFANIAASFASPREMFDGSMKAWSNQSCLLEVCMPT